MKCNLFLITSGDDIAIFKKMLQQYLHELGIVFEAPPIDPKTGLYIYDNIDLYFNNKDKFPYFIKKDNEIIGFILVDSEPNLNIIQEFYILDQYKHKGYGKDAATIIFNLKRGNWIIKALPKSLVAESFWTNVVSDYTNGNYVIDHIGKFNRAVFTFSNNLV